MLFTLYEASPIVSITDVSLSVALFNSQIIRQNFKRNFQTYDIRAAYP